MSDRAYILKRGAYDAPGDRVERPVPAACRRFRKARPETVLASRGGWSTDRIRSPRESR